MTDLLKLSSPRLYIDAVWLMTEQSNNASYTNMTDEADIFFVGRRHAVNLRCDVSS
jgi:hypothetical protein